VGLTEVGNKQKVITTAFSLYWEEDIVLPRQASSFMHICPRTQQTLFVRQTSQPEAQSLLNLALAHLSSFLSILLTTPHPSSTTFHLHQPQHNTIINTHALQRLEVHMVSPHPHRAFFSFGHNLVVVPSEVVSRVATPKLPVEEVVDNISRLHRGIEKSLSTSFSHSSNPTSLTDFATSSIQFIVTKLLCKRSQRSTSLFHGTGTYCTVHSF
jgi:hypothetical protein